MISDTQLYNEFNIHKRNIFIKLDLKIEGLIQRFHVATKEKLNKPLLIYTSLGNKGIFFVTIGLGLCFFAKLRLMAFNMLLNMLLGLILANFVIKKIFKRLRPYHHQQTCLFNWWENAGAIKENGYSFVSGHTTLATAFAIPLFLYLDLSYSWVFLLIPLVMAFTRMYFFVHFFSDCLGAFLLGILCDCFSVLIIYHLLMINGFNQLIMMSFI